MAKVGVIGLGSMGGGVAERLLAGGHEVHGWNRSRAKAERYTAKGLIVESTPRAVAAACELTITMIADDAALRVVSEGDDGIVAGLGPGKTFVELSTTGPSVIRELFEPVRARGATLLDAAVSGSPPMVREGKALIMVGGDRTAFDRALPILQAITSQIRYVGALGHAKALKIGTNISLAVQMLAFSEGILLAQKSGVDRQTAFDVFLHSVLASPMLQYRAPFVLNPPDQAFFTTRMMEKDLTLAVELGADVGVPLPSTAATREILTATRAMGFADEDFSVVFHALALMSGVQRDPDSIPPYAREPVHA